MFNHQWISSFCPNKIEQINKNIFSVDLHKSVYLDLIQELRTLFPNCIKYNYVNIKESYSNIINSLMFRYHGDVTKQYIIADIEHDMFSFFLDKTDTSNFVYTEDEIKEKFPQYIQIDLNAQIDSLRCNDIHHRDILNIPVDFALKNGFIITAKDKSRIEYGPDFTLDNFLQYISDVKSEKFELSVYWILNNYPGFKEIIDGFEKHNHYYENNGKEIAITLARFMRKYVLEDLQRLSFVKAMDVKIFFDTLFLIIKNVYKLDFKMVISGLYDEGYHIDAIIDVKEARQSLNDNGVKE